MINKPLQVTCKRCGRSAPSDNFVLDHLYGMLVCPDCMKEQKMNSKITKEAISKKASELMMSPRGTTTHSASSQPVQKPEEVKEKPPGWDSEDDYLERAFKQREKLKVNYERLDDFRIRYVCTKCGHKFVFHTEKRYPRICPNCGTNVVTSAIR